MMMSRCVSARPSALLAAVLLGPITPVPASAAPGDTAEETASESVPQASDAASLSERIVARDVAIAFPSLDDPSLRSAAEADHMRPDDVVAGLVLAGAARAYPWWILKNHHAVNDRLQGTDVLLAFCEQCSAATAFRRDLDDRVLELETEGVCNGSIILRDRQTGTLWAPFDGHALEGPLAGRKLARLPVFLTTWSDWTTRHPDTDVVHRPESERAGHGAREHPGKWGIVGQMGETLRSWDTRLAENDFVFGLRQGELARAYPLRTVQQRGGTVNDTVSDRPVLLFARGEFEMAAYDRRLGGKTLTFEPAGDAAQARDRETGSLWTVEGLAVRGPSKGRRLEPLDGYQVEWHVWSEYHPNTEIFEHEAYRPPTGFQLPFRSLPRLVGERVQNESLRLDAAELNLIMVWARWCPPCRDKVPVMQRLAAGQDAGSYRFVSIVVQLPDQDELGALKGFLYEHDIRWPIYLFDDPRYVELDEHYRAQGGRGLVIPTLFVADRSGKVLKVLEGPTNEAIDEILAQSLSKDN
ncbi:MAG: DUF3179 domain-containing (seleno)protein [Acidobacteriota bacterium]